MRGHNPEERFESHWLETVGFDRDAAQATAVFRMRFLVKPARIPIGHVPSESLRFPVGRR